MALTVSRQNISSVLYTLAPIAVLFPSAASIQCIREVGESVYRMYIINWRDGVRGWVLRALGRRSGNVCSNNIWIALDSITVVRALSWHGYLSVVGYHFILDTHSRTTDPRRLSVNIQLNLICLWVGWAGWAEWRVAARRAAACRARTRSGSTGGQSAGGRSGRVPRASKLGQVVGRSVIALL